MKLILIVMAFAIQPCYAQFTEHFDEDLQQWLGNSDFWLINDGGFLQSNCFTENSSFYISRLSNQKYGEWNFSVKLDFATSGTNYVDIFLMSESADPQTNINKGFFVRIGNTDDEISLYKKSGSTSIKIIDGINGSTLGSSCNFDIKVIRDSTSKFYLFRKNFDDSTYFFEGRAYDPTLVESLYFSIVVKQSTSSFFKKHFFDNISVAEFIKDTTPLKVTQSNMVNASVFKIKFNKPLDFTIAGNGNFRLNNNAVDAAFSGDNNYTILSFNNSFPEGEQQRIDISGLYDVFGNRLNDTTIYFYYVLPKKGDVVINEFMADPQPPQGLPEVEWIELKNNSQFDINLASWKLSVGNSVTANFPEYNLKPDSLLILCAPANKNAMINYGNCIALNTFPSLPNEEGLLVLKSPEGRIIHLVDYSDKWYGNAVKKMGGFSLEMIDPKNFCNGKNNFSASNNISGGTPGKVNSISASNPDVKIPFVENIFAIDSLNIEVKYSEEIDSLKAIVAANYKIENIVVQNASIVSPQHKTVNLLFATPLLRHKVYELWNNEICDCAGNVSSNEKVKFGLTEKISPGDIIVNEILFNPIPSGTDFVEIYNRTTKLLNLAELFISNKNSSGQMNPPVKVTGENKIFYPGEFMVLTRDAEIIKRDFVAQNSKNFIEMSLPSYNDDKGCVILLNNAGEVIDEVNYTEKWHYSLISNVEGISLERINYSGNSDAKELWMSAAKSHGYATPTYKNSQFAVGGESDGDIILSSKVISPNQDGIDDFLSIQYNFSEPGLLCSIIIFDEAGRPVRYLQRNALAGSNGNFVWDGLGENSRKLNSGLFIIYVETISIAGKRKKYKRAVALKGI